MTAKYPLVAVVSDAPFVILVHAYLGFGRDPESYAQLTASFDLDTEEDDGRLLSPTEVATIVCDEDPTQSLVEETRFGRAALGSITVHGLAELIPAGLDNPVGLLSHLCAHGSRRNCYALPRRAKVMTSGAEDVWPTPTSLTEDWPLPARWFASRVC